MNIIYSKVKKDKGSDYISEKKHRHHGKSSRAFIDAEEVMLKSGVKTGDVFLDAGCGDGHISVEASKVVGESGIVYALDVYEESINALKKEIAEKEIKNISALTADITQRIPLPNNEVDFCLMANVFHGFVENEELKESMSEIARVIKPGGIFGVLDFKKMENAPGPSISVKIAPETVTELLGDYHFDKVEVKDVGKYHYLLLLKLVE